VVLVGAALVGGILALTTRWMNGSEVIGLISTVGFLGLAGLLFTAWEHERVELHEYEDSGNTAPRRRRVPKPRLTTTPVWKR
jgi:hypothetical protein